jgi:hypothetical protein
MTVRKRKRKAALWACVVGAATALAAIPGTASAQSSGLQQSDPNPLSTNVPYLAWRGEHLRLVKCQSDLPPADIDALRTAPRRSDGGLGIKINTDVLVEDWSGPADFQPQVARGTIDLFLTNKGVCVKVDVISQKAGLAMIKMIVTIDPGEDSSFIDILTRSGILTVHQFLAGWLQLNNPTLTQLPVGGDENNLNHFRAGNDPANDGVLRVLVDGTLPLMNNFSELGLGGSINLPAGWPALANALGNDRNPDNPLHTGTQYRWDIHDSNAPVEGHPLQPSDCRDNVAFDASVGQFGDAVDNCLGGLSFSRVFDPSGQNGVLDKTALPNTTNGTIGPFDPQRPDETYLGDGSLTPDDAPMPSARVDVSIAAGGMGSLQDNLKNEWFSRDRLPDANAGSGLPTAHNLYAPFYDSYIPATNDGSLTDNGTPVSGTDGPPQGNNFPGYLADSPYQFWDIAHVFSTAWGQNTGCLRRTDEYPFWRQTNDGDQSVVVYTDEHGMAQVNYRPGTGTNYDSLAVTKNSNGGCDLAGVDQLGTASISATAVYPYQPTTDIVAHTSDPIVTTVHSRFAKFLTQFPKGPGDENANARIVVAHAQDVDGKPFAGETVCFNDTSGYGVVKPYVPDGFNYGQLGDYDLGGSWQTGETSSSTVVCMVTNDKGNAAVELLESQGRVVNIVGQFVQEKLFRDLKVDFGAHIPPPIPDPTPAPPPAIPGGENSGGGEGHVLPGNVNGNRVPSAAAANSTQAAVNKVVGAGRTPLSAGRTRVSWARLNEAKGKRTLTVRLDGGTKAKVRIKLFNKKGKAVARTERTLATGKAVKVTGLAISREVVRASITVIG